MAAFRLGLLSRAALSYVANDLIHAEYDVAERDVELAVDQLREARDCLADELHPNVFGELPRVLRRLRWLIKAALDRSLDPGDWERVDGSLRSLADSALAAGSSLQSYFEAGRALGAYHRSLDVFDPDTDGPDDAEQLPRMSGVVLAFVTLAASLKDPPALLGRVAALREVFEHQGQAAFLESLRIGDPKAPWCRPGLPLHLQVRMLLHELQEQAERGLESHPPLNGTGAVPATVATVNEKPARPNWKKEAYELWFRGHCIRTVRPLAKNVIRILDVFEEAGWPDRIDDPLYGKKDVDPVDRLHDTIRSLNDGVKDGTIRFKADGTSTGFRWSES